METAAPLARGGVAAELWLGYSNIFEQDSSATHMVFIDMERLTSAVTVRWGATDRLEVGGRVLLETTGPGVLDGAIRRWHELFGFGQANRDQFPEGRYAQFLSGGGDTVYLDVPRAALVFEDLRLFAKLLAHASPDGRNVLSARAEARIPGGSNPAAGERVDFALALLGRAGRGPWFVHGMVGASTLRASEELEPILRDASTFLTLALERSFGSFSAVAQYQVQSPVLRSFDHRELDRSPSNLVLGMSGALGERWRWDASFQEDLPSDTPAIDFTLGLRVSRSW
jgi:hypothetical protein